jgi:hypothetical protein
MSRTAAGDRRPRRTVPRPAYVVKLSKSLFFETSVGEKDLHNRVPVAFPGPEWGKIGGKNRRGLRAFGGDYTRCNSAVF